MLRKERREESGPRRGTGVQRLGHRAELLAHAHGLRGRDAESHRRRVGIEAQQAGAGGRGAKHSGRARDVPAAVVVIRID
jgi:hypothetical protein